MRKRRTEAETKQTNRAKTATNERRIAMVGLLTQNANRKKNIGFPSPLSSLREIRKNKLKRSWLDYDVIFVHPRVFVFKALSSSPDRSCASVTVG